MSRPAGHITGDLTPRQIEVLALVAQGMGDKEIARKLKLSHDRSVNKMLMKIGGHRGLRGRVQIAVWAVREGIV